MTSRERLIAAIHCEPVDYVPCAQYFYRGFPGRGPCASERALLDLYREFDLDGHVHLGAPTTPAPGVTSEVWKTEGGAVVNKVYHTPAGDLTAAIRPSEEVVATGRMSWNDIELFSDFNPAHYVKPWIATIQDIECFRHVQACPSEADIDAFRKNAASRKALADEYGYILIGGAGYGLTLLLDLMGAEALMLASMDQPELLDRFMEIEHAVNLCQIDLLASAGVDLIIRDGFYETTDFWSPEQIRRFVLPRINREAERAHARGIPLMYTVCTGIMPLLAMYSEALFDGLITYETKLAGQRLEPIAAALAGRKCLWGGISDCEDLGRGTPDTVRQAVRDLLAAVGRRGVIVSAVPSIKPDRPPANVLAFFDEWRRVRQTASKS